MATPKWLIVARNEYRIHTSKIRKIRPYFPILAIGLLAIYVVFIAPAFVNLFVDDFLALLLSEVAVAMVQIILFMVFAYFMIIPITETLREEQTGQLEIFLAAPLRSSDVLLGEFLGHMPFYAIFVVVITAGFAVLLNSVGMGLVQTMIVIMIFVVTFLSAFWIGTVVAAILRTRLGKTARGRDIGRALAMIIALPLVGLIYAFQFGGLSQILFESRSSGVIKTVLSLLPSSWGAEVIVAFAEYPGDIAAVGFTTLTRFGGLIVFFITVLWLGAKVADRAYSLEPVSFIASTAKPDGAFYKTIRFLGGGKSFGTLLVSIFKDYSRRLENLSNIIYILGLLFMMAIFIGPNVSTGSNDPPAGLIMAQFLFPVLVVMVTGEVTVRGQDTLFIYRKAPSAEGRLVKAMLLKSWLTAVPIAGAMTVVVTVLGSQIAIISLLTTTGLMMAIVAANVVFVLGLFLLNPAFSIKSVRLGINVIIAIFVTAGLFAVSVLILTRGGMLSGPLGGILYVQLLQTVMSWLVGILFLWLGKRRLTRIE